MPYVYGFLLLFNLLPMKKCVAFTRSTVTCSLVTRKSILSAIFLLSCTAAHTQVYTLDPKGAKKVRIETTNYFNSDTSKATQVLYFDAKGNVTKAVKYDAANEPTEQWTHSYKYEKDGRIKTAQSKFKDYTKQLKPQKFKTVYSYNTIGKLLKAENTLNQSGYECSYDSSGNLSVANDYNSKGFFGGAKFSYKDGRLCKQKYEWGNKPPETTEYVYDGKGRRIKALTYRGQTVIRKEEYTYVD
jgi:hypothetical protein